MSMLLTAKAMSIKVGNPLRKLVLVKLADNANDQGMCFPSYQYIADVCEISKRSAINHIDALIEMGLVSKKERKNKDGSSSNLYFLHLDKGSEIPAPPSAGDSLGSAGDAPPPSAGDAPPPSAGDAPITSHSINQSINHTTLAGSNARAKKSEAHVLLEQFGITDQLADDFITHRKACKAPITETALNGFQREADKAKIPIQRAVAISIERGWRGFRADWDWQGLPNNAKNKSSGGFVPDDSGNWGEGMTITLRGQE